MTQKTNLSAGRGYLAIPGPSVIPDEVLQSMHRAAPNIYAGTLPDMMPDLVADCALRHVQFGRRAGEAAMAGRSLKGPQCREWWKMVYHD